jgi:ribosomal protein S18 acetylase RimI-like enzyme
MATDVDLASAGRLSLEALASLFGAAFEGYLPASQATPASLAVRLRSEQVDLAQSRIARVDSTPVGLCLLARRGGTLRVAGMGTVQAWRERGIASSLLRASLELARQQGAQTVLLEVLEDNAVARRLYERAGLRARRRLTGWIHDGKPSDASTVSLRRADTVALARALAAEPARTWPWQLAPETVIAGGEWLAVHTLDDRAYAWVDQSQPESISLRHLFVRPDARRNGAARALLSAMLASRPQPTIRIPPLVPEDFDLEALVRLGFARTGRDQLEMALVLT